MKDIHAYEPIWENWVIDEEIGYGSYGTVWKAHREDQFSHVRQYAAVKHISIPKQDGQGEDDIPFPSEKSRSQYYRTMLNQLIVEIDAMVSLRGKANIVSYEEHKVVPKDQNSGYDLFLRMELLKSVPKHIKEIGRPLMRNEVIQLGIDIATALETLESRNFVHRDIKPDNIFIDDEGHFKLGDFGTARVLEATGNASTKTGTPNYMAPEVYTKSVQYHQTVDIYSLGIMLYRYMNNGYLPFMSETEISPENALVRRIRGEKIKAPCNAEAELSNIILKACAFEAKDRYQNAKELKKDLLKSLVKQFKDVEVSVVCQMDDGQEIYRGYKKAKTGSQVKISIEDTPYKKFIDEDKDIISAREILVTIDDEGKMNPPEARFIWSDFKTLFAVSVQIICRDENHNEILVQKTDCFYQNRNLVKAPTIDGYRPVGQTEIEVEVLKNRSSRPPQVVFEYKKGDIAAQTSDVNGPVECDVPVLCVLENGEEILNSKRTCRENALNIVTAPEITDYVLIGDDSKKISVSHTGNAEPDKVIFTYRKMKAEGKEVSIAVICRDDYGNELKRDSVVGKAGKSLNLTAPEIKGFKLINEDKKLIELNIDDNGVPEQDEVIFIYEKVKEVGQNRKKFTIIGVVVALLLISTGISIWLLNRPVQKYTVTWKHEDGTVLELDNEVAYGIIPEYNGPIPTKPDDAQYSYAFTGWTPSAEPVKTDVTYVAVFERSETAIVTIAGNPTDMPVPTFTITWSIGTETETATVSFGKKPTHADPVKEPDDQYTYTFAGWTPEVKEATEDTAYEAIFQKEIRSYTITWQDDAGKTIDTASFVYGTKPTHADPTKELDQQYSYSFAGWQPEVEVVKGDATYKATYNSKVKLYTITWQDDTGKTIDTTTVAYDTEPTHADPIKESDQQYSYSFSGWQPDIQRVTGDATYKAVYKKETRSYTIAWQNDVGKTIDTTSVAYGTKPTHTDPTKESDQQYSYSFSGWKPDIENVAGDATYKATFKKETRSYTITWQDDTGKTIDTTTVVYGTKPTHADTTKNSDQQYTNSFSGWQPELKIVTGDAIYKAVFKQEAIVTPKPGWTCLNCGEENTDENAFCTNCATPRGILQPTETPHSHAKVGNTWICSNCKAENSYDDTFCTNCAQTRLCLECGNSVPKDDKFCPNCATEVGKWKCSQCGTLLGEDDVFCVNCGTKRHKPGVR